MPQIARVKLTMPVKFVINVEHAYRKAMSVNGVKYVHLGKTGSGVIYHDGTDQEFDVRHEPGCWVVSGEHGTYRGKTIVMALKRAIRNELSEQTRKDNPHLTLGGAWMKTWRT